jgi:putative ABC transport system ATP-binding protein
VGQKQRLCILRAMLLTPDVLLLDEPTAALDRDNARRVVAIVTELNRKEKITILMVSHNPEDARDATARIRLGGFP